MTARPTRSPSERPPPPRSDPPSLSGFRRTTRRVARGSFCALPVGASFASGAPNAGDVATSSVPPRAVDSPSREREPSLVRGAWLYRREARAHFRRDHLYVLVDGRWILRERCGARDARGQGSESENQCGYQETSGRDQRFVSFHLVRQVSLLVRAISKTRRPQCPQSRASADERRCGSQSSHSRTTTAATASKPRHTGDRTLVGDLDGRLCSASSSSPDASDGQGHRRAAGRALPLDAVIHYLGAERENAFNEFNRVSLFLAAFLLVSLAAGHGKVDRWVDGLTLAIVAIALVALMSRLFPGLFPDRASSLSFQVGPSGSTSRSVTGTGSPLSQRSAFPLALRVAIRGRNSIVRGIALASLPVVASVIYLASSSRRSSYGARRRDRLLRVERAPLGHRRCIGRWRTRQCWSYRCAKNAPPARRRAARHRPGRTARPSRRIRDPARLRTDRRGLRARLPLPARSDTSKPPTRANASRVDRAPAHRRTDRKSPDSKVRAVQAPCASQDSGPGLLHKRALLERCRERALADVGRQR